jgi:GNAT superfamily N-acetyltransferase
MGKVREIVVEMMGVLKSGLPEPELKIVNDEKLEWVGHTDWNYGIQNGTTFADPTTAISIQKKALVDDRTLRRIVAHELCHHEEFLVIEAGKLSKLGFEKYEQQKETDTHGTEWKKIAARFNAKYGEDFVTEESDKDFVVAKTASPDFGYSQYNDRDKDIAKLTWEVIPNSYHGGFEMYVHDPSIPGPEKGGSFDNVVGQMFCFEFFPNDPSDKSPEKNIAIDSVNIQDPWFGTGLGQMLYDRAIAEAKKEGYDRFWSDKTRSASAESAWSKLKTRYPVRQAYTKWMDTPRRRYVIDLDQPWSKAKAAAITCVACECGDCFLHTASVDVAKLRNLLNLKQRIPVEEIFYHPYTSSRWIRDAFNDHGDVEVQNVDVSKVVPGQRWIFTSEVKKHLKENGELPSVIKRDGLYYMWDGHHKTVARMLEGHDHVEMEVADWLDMGKIATPQAKDQAAPAPGSKPIPPRTVRLWHYTREENLDAIRQQGLLRSKGRGDDLSGGGPSAGVWASSNVPSTSDLRSRPYIEFWAKPEQISHNANYPDSWKLNKSTKEYEKKSEIDQEMLDEWAQGYRHVIMNGDVPVDQILAIHEPWMDEARYLMDNWDRPDCEWLHDPKEVEKFKKDNMPSEARALAYVQKVKGTDVPKTAAVSKPEKISTKDVPEALEVAAVCFPQFADVVEPIVREALGNNFDMSYVTKDEGKIVGGYFLANNPLPADVKGAEQYQGKKGIEGVALFVLPEYRGKGTGHALRDLPLHLGADYIWGQHFEELNNLQPWINFGRKHMDTIDGVHITLMDFHKTASAVRYFWPDSEDDEEDTGDTCSFYTQAYTLAKDSGLNILRDKDPACYALDGERVVGCLFVTDSNQKFSFDIAVDPKFRNKGIGTKLIDMGIQEYEQRKEAFDDYSYSLDVINPSMKKILERKGFQVDEDLGNRWVMSKTADAKSEDESVGRIKQQLEAIKGIRGELPKHIKYSLESFILEFGKHYYTDKNSFKGKRGVQKQCYMNAYKLMMDNPNLTYVEGHVDIGPMSVEHAWCVTKAGIVIDPTLPPPVETQTVRPQGYFGVPFSSEYVMETASKTGVYGILSYTNRNLFSGKIEPEDFLAKTAKVVVGSSLDKLWQEAKSQVDLSKDDGVIDIPPYQIQWELWGPGCVFESIRRGIISWDGDLDDFEESFSWMNTDERHELFLEELKRRIGGAFPEILSYGWEPLDESAVREYTDIGYVIVKKTLDKTATAIPPILSEATEFYENKGKFASRLMQSRRKILEGLKWIWSERTGPIFGPWKSSDGTSNLHADLANQHGLPYAGRGYDNLPRGTIEFNKLLKKMIIVSYHGGEDVEALARSICNRCHLSDDWRIDYSVLHPKAASRLMQKRAAMADSELGKVLKSLKPQFAAAAQKVYDEWDASDETYGDAEVGFGGICHLIVDEWVDLVAERGYNATSFSHSEQVHVSMTVWANPPERGEDEDEDDYASEQVEVFDVDLNPYNYETGGGYSWKKIPDVTIDPGDISIYGQFVSKEDLQAIEDGF